jgi:hypothetical protein
VSFGPYFGSLSAPISASGEPVWFRLGFGSWYTWVDSHPSGSASREMGYPGGG